MTDPARTTKDELLPCPFCGAAALLEDDDAGCMNDQCILACFAYPLERWNTRADAADAADALRAQVAALQAELAAAQAKLAVPVLKDVQDMAESLWLLDIDEAADMLTALARDNAALRTKAEALERERDVWYCGLCCKDMPWTGSGRCADCGTKLAEKL